MSKSNYKRGAPSRTKAVMKGVAHEMKKNPPKILAHTRSKFGAKRSEEQRVAIMMNKARKRGASIKKSA